MWNNYNTAYPGSNNPPQGDDGAPPSFPFSPPAGFAPPGGAPPPSHSGYHPGYGAYYNPPVGGPGEFGNSNPYAPPQTTPYSPLPPQIPHRPQNGPPPQPPRSTYPGQQAHQSHHQYQPGPRSDYPGQPPNFGYPSNGPPPPGGNHPIGGGPPAMPPSQHQSYGPVYQNANQQNVQQTFQYSQCTGKKKALCIGINYFGQQGELKGCINDANNLKRFLCGTYGYREEDIVILTDDARNPRQVPTKTNMLQAMEWLVRDAKTNDSLFFHYSGHGGQTKDLDGDEEDGYDEVIYPVDFRQNGHILDDTMFEIMVRPLPPGCRLTAIFDSCHSGTALDLPFMYSTDGKIKEPNMAADLGQELMGLVSSYSRKDMGGLLKSGMGMIRTAGGQSQKIDNWAKRNRSSPADVISWSGCKDDQTSADTSEAGQATGAMSFAFISVLSTNSRLSYQQLLVGIRNVLQSKYSQKPQLSSSHPIDTLNLLFVC